MKFVSKSTNLHVIIQPGLSAQPLSGTPEKPRVSVKFVDGIVDIKDDVLAEKMLNHPGFNQDFFLAEPGRPDPYAYVRGEVEPQHTITEIQFGHPIARVGGNAKPQLSPEIRKLLQEEAASMATEMAKAMLPEMVEATLKQLAQSVKDDGEVAEAVKDAPDATVEAQETIQKPSQARSPKPKEA